MEKEFVPSSESDVCLPGLTKAEMIFTTNVTCSQISGWWHLVKFPGIYLLKFATRSLHAVRVCRDMSDCWAEVRLIDTPSVIHAKDESLKESDKFNRRNHVKALPDNPAYFYLKQMFV